MNQKYFGVTINSTGETSVLLLRATDEQEARNMASRTVSGNIGTVNEIDQANLSKITGLNQLFTTTGSTLAS